MRPYIIFFGFFILSFSSIAQNSSHQIQLLENSLQHQRDTARIRPLIQLAQLKLEGDSLASLTHAKEAMAIAQKSDHRWGIAWSTYQLAMAHRQLSDQASAAPFAEQSLGAFFYGEVPLSGEAFMELSAILGSYGDVDQTQQLYLQAIAYFSNQKDSSTHAKALFRKAKLDQKRGDLNLAKTTFLSSIALLEELGEHAFRAKVINAMAVNEERLGNDEAALKYYQQVHAIGKQIGVPPIIVGSSMNISSFLNKIGRTEEALIMAERTLEQARQIPDKSLLAANLHIAGNCYGRLGRYTEAIARIEEAIQVSEAHNQLDPTVKMLVNVSILHQESGNLKLGLEQLIKAISMCHEYEVSYLLPSCYVVMGELYQRMEIPKKAMASFERAAQASHDHQDAMMYLKSQLGLGGLWLAQQDYKKANYYYRDALKSINDMERLSLKLGPYLGLTQLALERDSLSKAQYWLEKAHAQQPDRIKNSAYHARLLWVSGLVALRMKAFEKSIDYFKSSLQHHQQSGSFYIKRDCYAGLADATKMLHQFEASARFREKQMLIQDSLMNAKLTYQIMDLQTDYETKQKEQQISSLEKEKQVQALLVANQQSELTQQQRFLLLLIFGVVLLSTVVILFFNRYKLQQKNEKLVLEARQFELEKEQEKVNRQLEMAELKSEFFTNVSHEFRTPLTLILGPLEHLLKDAHHSEKSTIQQIQRNASQLLNLVNETLDLSKLNSGFLTPKRTTVALGDFVRHVAQGFTAHSETSGVSLHIENQVGDLCVPLDTDQFNKVLVNLLGNAFQHTSAGDAITIRLATIDDDHLQIQVQDTGVGIEAKHHALLFDRFYQVDPHAKGTGIGLALTKELVALHGGNIAVSSTKGVGSTFSITLPFTPQHAQQAATLPLQPKTDQSTALLPDAAAKNNTVLVIEDHAEVRAYLHNLLEAHYRVLVATDGDEGIRIAEEHNPDLIISDIMMPQKDGLELTQHLKQQLPTSHIPIVLLTAKASINHKMEGLETGADAYLTKPFHTGELLQTCRNLITQRAKLREIFSTNYFLSPKKLTQNKVDQAFLEKAIQLIENHLDNSEFSVEQFCQELGMNRSGVHLKLKALTNKNTSQFIKSIRLKEAAKLLRESTKSISEISDVCGFGSRETFNKAFREQFECTPTEFRKKKGNAFIQQTAKA